MKNRLILLFVIGIVFGLAAIARALELSGSSVVAPTYLYQPAPGINASPGSMSLEAASAYHFASGSNQTGAPLYLSGGIGFRAVTIKLVDADADGDLYTLAINGVSYVFTAVNAPADLDPYHIPCQTSADLCARNMLARLIGAALPADFYCLDSSCSDTTVYIQPLVPLARSLEHTVTDLGGGGPFANLAILSNGNIDVGGQRVVNAGVPLATGDLATKGYVDAGTFLDPYTPPDGTLNIIGGISVRASGGPDGSEQYGEGAIASALYSSSYGYAANTSQASSVAVGAQSVSSGINCVAVGRGSTCSSNNCVAIGQASTCSQTQSVAVGHGSSATQFEATVIGDGAFSDAPEVIAIGYDGLTDGQWGIGVGNSHRVRAPYAVGVGFQVDSSCTGSISVGGISKAHQPYGLAIGKNSVVGVAACGSGGSDSVAVGRDTSTGDFDSCWALGRGTACGATSTIYAGNPTFPLDMIGSGAIKSTATESIGWSVVTVVNQACNTTCAYACVFGQDVTTGLIVDCANATADKCVCAGPN